MSLSWFWFGCACVAVGSLFLVLRQREGMLKAIEDRKIEADRLRGEADRLQKMLEKYRPILDAKMEAKRILDNVAVRVELESERHAKKLAAWSDDAKSRIDGIVERKRRELADQADAIERRKSAVEESHATEQAGKIIADARMRVVDLRAKEVEVGAKVDAAERRLEAIQNKVEGYGNRYIVPPATLVDELAGEYSSSDLGAELQRVRQAVRASVKHRMAGECGYVDAARKNVAVDFVVDAFNGKIEEIISRAKKENAGKLAQEIQDSFDIVNLNGSSFRDARITEAYKELRIRELKLVSAIFQMKEMEREKQREIKEKIREEEKAMREYEIAQKEARKQEEAIRKALEAERLVNEKISAEEKAKSQDKIRELENQLQEAIAKGQRAKSMAEQTRAGNVYVISNLGAFGPNVFKIGMTRRLVPSDRVRELGGASVPFEFDIHAMIPSEDAPRVEREIHKKLALNQVNKVNWRKEFFKTSIGEIKEVVSGLGIVDVVWVDEAVARAYRDTLGVEQRLSDPVFKESWLNERTSKTVDEIIRKASEGAEMGDDAEDLEDA